MVKFYKARDGVHKYVAQFNDGKKVKFGALGYEDYTQHGDTKRMRLYLLRHRKNEDWNDPKTAGALSRWILWYSPSIDEAIKHYIKKFHMYLE